MHQHAWLMQFPRKDLFIWTLEMLTSPGVSSVWCNSSFSSYGTSARLVRSRLNHSRDPGSPPQIRSTVKHGERMIKPPKSHHRKNMENSSWIQPKNGRDPHQTRYSHCGSKSKETIKKGEASPSNVMFPARPRSNSRCHMASMGSCTYLENLDQRIHGAVLVVVGDQINSLTKDPESRTIYQVYVRTAHCSVIYYLHLPTTSCQNQKHPTHTTSEWILPIFRSSFRMLNPTVV